MKHHDYISYELSESIKYLEYIFDEPMENFTIYQLECKVINNQWFDKQFEEYSYKEEC